MLFCLTASLNLGVSVCVGTWDGERDTPAMGPSNIINIKKEKRETEEETKEILRMLDKDNVSSTLDMAAPSHTPNVI